MLFPLTLIKDIRESYESRIPLVIASKPAFPNLFLYLLFSSLLKSIDAIEGWLVINYLM